jgi:hypothetical protein
MNRAVELHDSEIDSITLQGEELRVEFRVVYTHQSVDEPGVTDGTGWYERATLVLSDASINKLTPVELPALIYDGWAEINAVRHDNVFPLPLDDNSRLTLHCETYDGPLEVTGTVKSFALHGRVGDIERFES